MLIERKIVTTVEEANEMLLQDWEVTHLATGGAGRSYGTQHLIALVRYKDSEEKQPSVLSQPQHISLGKE